MGIAGSSESSSVGVAEKIKHIARLVRGFYLCALYCVANNIKYLLYVFGLRFYI